MQVGFKMVIIAAIEPSGNSRMGGRVGCRSHYYRGYLLIVALGEHKKRGFAIVFVTDSDFSGDDDCQSIDKLRRTGEIVVFIAYGGKVAAVCTRRRVAVEEHHGTVVALHKSL